MARFAMDKPLPASLAFFHGNFLGNRFLFYGNPGEPAASRSGG
jgi:hypothetical protein